MGQFQVNDASIYYEMKGSGPPVILIAGYTCDNTLWIPIFDHLAEHFQVVALDNRGVGRTKDSGAKLSAELCAQDVNGLAKAPQLKKPHIVGQSMGGTIAQKHAALYPDETGKLVLMVTSAKWRQAMLLGLKAHLSMRQQGADPNLIFESTIPWVFGEKFLRNSKEVEQLKQILFENPYPQSVEDQARQMAVLEEFDGREDLGKIKAETLVMYAEEDIISLPFESKLLAQGISNASLEGLRGAHGIIIENPENTAESLLRFLKS